MAATTISDIGDLVRILKEQPEWAEVIRGILLNVVLCGKLCFGEIAAV